MAISEAKKNNLKKKMEKLGIKESSFQEKFIKGSGAGGQKINKTTSCVQIQHPETGIKVKCQKSRLLQENRFFARRILVEKIEALRLKADSKKQQEIAKLRKQKKKRSQKAKEKVLKFKKERKEKKELRAQPRQFDF